MKPHIEAIWNRMPDTDRERVNACIPLFHDQLIELWEAAERFERSGRGYTNHGPTAQQQDDLDEALLVRVTKGEYGPDARDAVAQCASQSIPGASRRAFLREMRKAVESTRH